MKKEPKIKKCQKQNYSNKDIPNEKRTKSKDIPNEKRTKSKKIPNKKTKKQKDIKLIKYPKI